MSRPAASSSAAMPDRAARNVVVTGGSRGLGLAIARRLAEAGYGAIAVARHMSDQLNGAIKQNDNARAGSLDFVAFDLADTDGIPALVRKLRKQFGSLYGLVNNAGLGTDGLLGIMKDSDIERLLRVNTLAPIML